jgi:hypothetical protein
MSRVIVHIGQHKTGTTSLQHWLSTNREALAADGVCYPNATIGHGVGHHLLKDLALNPEEGSTEVLDDLVAEIRQASNDSITILSSERLATLHPAAFLQLLDRLSEFDVSVLAVYRNPLSWCRSMWQEQIKQGNFSDFREFLFNELLLTGTAVSTRFLSLLDAVKAEDIPLEIYNFDRISETHDNIIKFFASDIFNFPVAEDANAWRTKGLSAEFVELLRALNMTNAVCLGRPISSDVRVRLQKEFSGDVRTFFKSVWEPFFVNRHETIQLESKFVRASPLGRGLATLAPHGQYPFQDNIAKVDVLNIAQAFAKPEIRDFCYWFLSAQQSANDTSQKGI